MKSLNEHINEGKQRDLNNMAQYIIDLNIELSHEDNPKRKKMILGDIEEAKKKLAALKESKSIVNEEIDYLEDYEKQPKDVQKLIAKYEEHEGDYKKMKELQGKLAKIGWEMDYGLDGSIESLQPKAK